MLLDCARMARVWSLERAQRAIEARAAARGARDPRALRPARRRLERPRRRVPGRTLEAAALHDAAHAALAAVPGAARLPGEREREALARPRARRGRGGLRAVHARAAERALGRARLARAARGRARRRRAVAAGRALPRGARARADPLRAARARARRRAATHARSGGRAASRPPPTDTRRCRGRSSCWCPAAARSWHRSGGPRSSPQPPRVWVLADDRPGNTTQSTGLADALALALRDQAAPARAARRGCTTACSAPRASGSTRERSSPLEPPWPELVIAAGRRTAPVALWIREQSAGRTRLVQLGRKGADFADLFDLAVTPAYCRLFAHPKRIETSATLHAVSRARLAEAARALEDSGSRRRPRRASRCSWAAPRVSTGSTRRPRADSRRT